MGGYEPAKRNLELLAEEMTPMEIQNALDLSARLIRNFGTGRDQ